MQLPGLFRSSCSWMEGKATPSAARGRGSVLKPALCGADTSPPSPCTPAGFWASGPCVSPEEPPRFPTCYAGGFRFPFLPALLLLFQKCRLLEGVRGVLPRFCVHSNSHCLCAPGVCMSVQMCLSVFSSSAQRSP